MKIKHLAVVLLGFITYFAIYYMILSYGNVKAHPSINGAIVEKFDQIMNDPSQRPKKFEKYEFKFETDKTLFKGKAVTNPGFFPATTGQSEMSFTLKDWIKHGGYSADEPEVPASVRHFYDPIGLTDGKKYLTNNGTWWEGYYANPSTDAIEWALGDTPKGEGNYWSLKDGKTNLYLAFSTKDTNERKSYMAKAFRCIGEVMHNTADMGCPPHVRNDSHASPMGHNMGWFMGSPDPYEEYLVDSCGNTYKEGAPDGSLESFFESAGKIRDINEHLAEFTNENFFTHETINGYVGIYYKSPINKDGGYPNPRLENLDYDATTYTFSKKFPSGRTVELCKDYSFFSLKGRGYPYVDLKSVKSQAKELIPNIISAGVNVMRLFIPEIKIEISDTDVLSDTIEINVTHHNDDEYQASIYYKGPIKFKLNGKVQDSILVLEDRKFKGVLPFPIKNGDKLEAFIDMYAFIINCDKEVVVKMDPLWGIWHITEVLESSNDPAAPAKGTVFNGVKFFQILSNGMIKITNLDGTGLMQLNYSRNGFNFTISGSNSKQSYTQNGSVSNNQDAWSAQTKSTYKQGSGSSEVEYYRQYNSSGSRNPKTDIKGIISKKDNTTKNNMSYDVINF